MNAFDLYISSRQYLLNFKFRMLFTTSTVRDTPALFNITVSRDMIHIIYSERAR